MNRLADSTVDIAQVLAILRRQGRLVAATVALILAISVLYLMQTVPVYTAQALVRIDPRETNLLDPTPAPVANAAIESSRIETEVEILKSTQLALRTIAAADLPRTPEFGPQPGRLDPFRAAFGLALPPLPTGEDLLTQTLGRFQQALRVHRQGLTLLVVIKVTAQDPNMAARLANIHAETYIADQVQTQQRSLQSASLALRSELSKAAEHLRDSNAALDDYVLLNLDRLRAEAGGAALAGLSQQVQDNDQTVGALTTRLRAADAAFAAQDWADLAGALGDQAVDQLVQQRADLLRKLAGDTGRAIDIPTALADLDRTLMVQASQAISTVKTDLHQRQLQQNSMLTEIRRSLSGSSLSSRSLTDIYALTQAADGAQQQYDLLAARLRALDAQATLAAPSSRIVSPAIAPGAASFPNSRMTLLAACFCALMLGAVLALVKEYYYGGVTSASQLANVLPVKVGAVIPHQTGQEQAPLADKIIQEPMTLFAESFRKLRAGLDQKLARHAQPAGAKGAVIMVSSALPGEGKSTTALSLARTYAMAGKRALLVDADLRNPSLHHFIAETPGVGLLEYLQAWGSERPEDTAKSAEEFYVRDPLSPLGVILGSRRANVPTDAPLQSTGFAEMIENARAAFDVVVVDTAPMGPVVDAQYVAPLADAAVICVRFGAALQTDLRATHAQLSDALPDGRPILSVLTCFEAPRKPERYAGYYDG